MKKYNVSFIFATVFFLVFTANNAQAALASYMTIEGSNQGPIEGSVDIAGREGTIAVNSLGHYLSVPYDPNNGAPSERRAHSPLRILKQIDKSSPKLYRALGTGERLNFVIIKFYEVSPEGQEEHYYTIRLEDAYIISITPSYPATFDPDSGYYPHMESVGFTYRRIKWTFEDGGIEFEDMWDSR